MYVEAVTFHSWGGYHSYCFRFMMIQFRKASQSIWRYCFTFAFSSARIWQRLFYNLYVYSVKYTTRPVDAWCLEPDFLKKSNSPTVPSILYPCMIFDESISSLDTTSTQHQAGNLNPLAVLEHNCREMKMCLWYLWVGHVQSGACYTVYASSTGITISWACSGASASALPHISGVVGLVVYHLHSNPNHILLKGSQRSQKSQLYIYWRANVFSFTL